MLISDWSSDVCSSDLGLVEGFLTRTIRSWRPPLHHSALPNGPAPRSGEVFGRASSPRVVHRRAHPADAVGKPDEDRSEEHTSELQSLMRISYAVFCLKKKNSQ